MVSICCTTYNHANFIRDTIEGFLIQETDFPIEIIVHDDASLDNTQVILRQYNKQYPGLIRLILQETNQYSKGLKPNLNFVFPKARGKYIALCEGDDCWTDPLKLQKQINILEKNPEYSLVVGGYKNISVNTGEEVEVVKRLRECDHELGYSFSLLDTLNGWITKTLTAVFRRNDLNLDEFREYRYSRDINLFYHLLKTGKGFYITDVLGVYRIHEGGVNSMRQGMVNQNNAYRIYRELFEVNRDEFTRVMSFRCALELFSYDLYNSYEGNSLRKNLQTIYYAARLVRNWGEFRMLMNSFLSRDLKTTIKGKLSIGSDKQENLSERLIS